MVWFWGEGRGGELSPLAGVCEHLLAPWDLPWGRHRQGEPFLNKLGFPFTNSPRLLGCFYDEFCDEIRNLSFAEEESLALRSFGGSRRRCSCAVCPPATPDVRAG